MGRTAVIFEIYFWPKWLAFLHHCCLWLGCCLKSWAGCSSRSWRVVLKRGGLKSIRCFRPAIRWSFADLLYWEYQSVVIFKSTTFLALFLVIIFLSLRFLAYFWDDPNSFFADIHPIIIPLFLLLIISHTLWDVSSQFPAIFSSKNSFPKLQ